MATYKKADSLIVTIYMNTYTVVIEKGEDGYYIASVPAIPKCHTQGKTVAQALDRIKEAIQLCDKEIDRCLLRKIIRECEVSVDEFMKNS